MLSKHARIARSVLSILLIVSGLVLTANLIRDLNHIKHLQTDLAEINDVRYGLLNASVWVEQVSRIIDKRINEFELTDTNRPEIKQNIELVLRRLIDEVEAYLRKRNASGENWLERLGGSLKQGIQDIFVDFDDLRAEVPHYADTLLEELQKPEVKEDLKQQIIEFVEQAADATFTELDTTELDLVLLRYRCDRVEDCRARLVDAVELQRQWTWIQTAALLGLILALFAVNRFRDRDLPAGKLVLFVAATLLLLAGGILTPMLEIEAKIDELSFRLLGEPIVFTDQVLYFQSKSIVDVVVLLIDTGKWDVVIVGVLITLFSVAFPALKMISTFLYYYDIKHLRNTWFVEFFALKSGKWSMADVLVVALFMAYIGFRGLVSSQLGSIANAGGGVEVLTTNGTALQVGFFLFLGFCLASLVVSSLLEAHVNRHAT